MYKPVLFCVFLAMCLYSEAAQPVFAQVAPTVSSPLAARLDEAMAHARLGDFKPALFLMRHEKGILPLLGKYKNDPSPGVQDVLMSFAQKGHSPENVKIYSALVAQCHEQSIDELYRNYSPDEVRKWGGLELKRSLIKYVREAYIYSVSTYCIEGIMMLSAFSPDPEVRALLDEARANHLLSTVKENGRGIDYGRIVTHQEEKKTQLLTSDPILFSLPLDVALSEERDQGATKRVVDAVQHGDVNGTLFLIFEVTRFIRQKHILAQMVELVNDKRPTNVVFSTKVLADVLKHDSNVSTSSDPSEIRFRVCDLAIRVLARKTRADVGIPDLVRAIQQNQRDLPARNYTDTELESAYLALKMQLSN